VTAGPSWKWSAPRRVPRKVAGEVKAVVVLLLTIRRRGVFFLLILIGKGSMADKPSDPGSRHCGHAHSENAGARTHARIRDRPPARTDEQGRFPPQCRFAVCRLSAAATSGADQKRMEGENSRRAKYYVLTDQGRKRLNSETREWGRQVAAMARILEAS
jgi:hypothetical protein